MKHSNLEQQLRSIPTEVPELMSRRIDETLQQLANARPVHREMQQALQRPPRKKWSRKRWATLIAGCVVLGIGVPAAATMAPINWHGINISIDTGFTYDKGMEDPHQTLKRSIELTEQSYSVDEYRQIAPYPLLRPNPDNAILPLVRSIGLKHRVSGSPEPGHENTFYFWDQFEQGQQWAFVGQRLDEQRTMTLQMQKNGANISNSSTYASYYKPVQIGGDTVGFLADHGRDGKMLKVSALNDQQQVIELTIESNLPENQMIVIARNYIPHVSN